MKNFLSTLMTVTFLSTSMTQNEPFEKTFQKLSEMPQKERHKFLETHPNIKKYLKEHPGVLEELCADKKEGPKEVDCNQNGKDLLLALDCNAKSGFPDSNIKRGFLFKAAIKKRSSTDIIAKAKELGMRIVALDCDLNQYDEHAPKESPFISYRSRGPDFFGADGEIENFSLDQNRNIQIHVNSFYLEVVKTAIENNLQIVFQNSGSPVCGQNDGSVQQLFKLDPERKWNGGARYYPIPVREQYNLYADVVYRWIRSVIDQSGVKNAICIGTQEPEHTIGLPSVEKNKSKGTRLADKNAEIKNVENYADLWSLIAKRLAADGVQIGALQNNMGLKLAGQSKYYISLAALSKNHTPLDFFTIQNYQYLSVSPPTEEIIASAKAALAQFPEYRSKKIFFDRYEPIGLELKDFPDHNNSLAIIDALNSEKQVLNSADNIYGYLAYVGWEKPLWQNMFGFLNAMPPERRDITGINKKGVDAFAYSNDQALSIAVWNKSNITHNITLNLKNIPKLIQSGTIIATKGSGSNATNLTITFTSSGLSQFELAQNEYILISIKNTLPKS